MNAAVPKSVRKGSINYALIEGVFFALIEGVNVLLFVP